MMTGVGLLAVMMISVVACLLSHRNKKAAAVEAPTTEKLAPAAKDDYRAVETDTPSDDENGTAQLFLSLFGMVYIMAFASYWLQYPGLFSSQGLSPVKQYWDNVHSQVSGTSTDEPFKVPFYGDMSFGDGFQQAWRDFCRLPCALWLRDTPVLSGIDVDIVMEGTAILGLLCGIAASLGIHHGMVFLTAFLAYLSLFNMGQTFLGFQWDIFLLETGGALVLFAPWWSLRGVAQPGVNWIMRALWVKFMLMSGAVKVQAQCPTWKNLTALEYHFASTCLPTSEAWIHHSLPPFLLRLAVALMFLLEVIAPWLLLVPIRAVRRVGVMVQVPLQVLIMLTGNYNWFNIHTAVLLMPAWDSDCLDTSVAPLFGALSRLITMPFRGWHSFWNSRFGTILGSLSTWCCLGCAWYTLFPLEYKHHDAKSGVMGWWLALGSPDGYEIRNEITETFVTGLFEALLTPQGYLALYACLTLSAICHALQPPRGIHPMRRLCSSLWRLLLGLFCVVYLGSTLLPMESIHESPGIPLKKEAKLLSDTLQSFHISNSYGLFRRMTGVGDSRGRAGGRNWGGLPPSVVEVPAVVVEGSHDKGRTWHEIPFRYAPYKPERAPRRTAPHQPRLDWQMWFAALGSYQHNPWLLHLIWQLLRGRRDSAAIDLLDGEAYPFDDRPRNDPKLTPALTLILMHWLA